MVIPLFDDWTEFMFLFPEEKIVNVYMDVSAASEYKEKGTSLLYSGDLVLTDKRLVHLEYEYKRRRTSAHVAGVFICLFLLLFSLFLPPLLLITLSLFIVSLFLLRGKLLPMGYRRMSFEVSLEKIGEAIESFGGLKIEVMYRKMPIFLRFNDMSHMHEFKKNLSYLVYEAQHRPEEIVQYNIVTKFSLGRDGAISVQCPYCGASAPLQTKESEVACKYCGKQYVVPKKLLDLIG